MEALEGEVNVRNVLVYIYPRSGYEESLLKLQQSQYTALFTRRYLWILVKRVLDKRLPQTPLKLNDQARG